MVSAPEPASQPPTAESLLAEMMASRSEHRPFFAISSAVVVTTIEPPARAWDVAVIQGATMTASVVSTADARRACGAMLTVDS